MTYPLIGTNGISVPQLCNKVLIDIRGPNVGGIGFILSNKGDGGTLENFALPIDAVEDLTGLDFFPVVADTLEEAVHVNRAACTGFGITIRLL